MVFADECEVHLHPRLAKVWQKKGKPMKVPAAGADRKFAIFGGLEYFSGKMVWRIAQRKNSDEFLAFLEQLREAFPDEVVVVVLDNVGYHKSRVCRAWWEKEHHRMRPFWLPVYTPQLNLIERLWRDLKDKISCHRWWSDLEALETAVNSILSNPGVKFKQHALPSTEIAQNLC